MAEREELLAKAEKIASLIFEKLRELRGKAVKDMGIGSWLSFFKLRTDMEKSGESRDEALQSLDPKIHEVILFGSVAEGKESPTDIDLMVFDNGHFSNFFPCMTSNHHMEDWYKLLEDNLEWLMSAWFGVGEDQLQEILGEVEVDLHVLPVSFFRSEGLREEIAGKHKDPDFFKNTFRKAMRFNCSTKEFEPLTLEYLEEKFRCALPDLR